MISNILSIAGSDPSGGAGIQADLKTFSALGCYGMAAITALTAQNTKGVTGIHEVPANFVAQQIETVFADIRVDAVKIGMVGGPETIHAIAGILKKRKPAIIVFDPVMVAQSGNRLVSDEAIKTLKQELIPLATIITPNIPEADALLSMPIVNDLEDAARKLAKMSPVFLKGGHIEGPICVDVYADREKTVVMESPRIKTKNNHGTGCTLSSALACYLVRGLSPEQACRAAKEFVTGALLHSEALTVGQGHGPVHHFSQFWEKAGNR